MNRGERNNNPLNIRHSADQWQGAAEEQTDKSFVQFTTMAYGYRAAWKVLQSYYNHFMQEGKHYTVRNIIYRWAPPSDNNATEAYIRKVLQLSGIGGNENLLPPSNATSYGRLSKMVAAMTCIECGIPLSKVDDEAICNGYRLAFPENKTQLNECLREEDEYCDW